MFRLAEEVGATADDAVRAFSVVSDVFGLPALWSRIAAADVPSEVADELVLVTRGCSTGRRAGCCTATAALAVGSGGRTVRGPIEDASAHLEEWLVGADRTNLRGPHARDRGAGRARGPGPGGGAGPRPVRTARRRRDRGPRGMRPDRGGELYFRCVNASAGSLLNGVSALGKTSRWDALARLALRDELYEQRAGTDAGRPRHATPGDDTDRMIADWEERNASRLRRARNSLAEISASVSGTWRHCPSRPGSCAAWSADPRTSGPFLPPREEKSSHYRQLPQHR
ncbi:hypothetical protein GS944_01400 [Rhodococcus hoagii]|nr:hypothetical protein [Prescottella equi]